VVTFGIGVLISWASGGSALALELQDPALTGLTGIACLASVALGRPLHPIILRWLGRNNARYSDIASRTQKKTSMMTAADAAADDDQATASDGQPGEQA
jgi:hypothetical protein